MPKMDNKIMTWNVNGLNSPQKRRIVFNWLKKQKCIITCLQKVHVKNKDSRLLKNNQLDQEFFPLSNARKRGVSLYIKQELQPKQKFKDNDGRLLGVKIILEGEKTLLVGLYAPNGAKEKFLLSLKQNLDQDVYEQIILMGDYNGVIDPKLDKFPAKKGGKLPKLFFEIAHQEQLEDIWRGKNGNLKDFTFYSASKKSFSRIDML